MNTRLTNAAATFLLGLAGAVLFTAHCGSSSSGNAAGPGGDAGGSPDAGLASEAAVEAGGNPGGGDGGNGGTGSASVLQRGNDLYRRGTFTEPGLTKAMVPMMAPDTTFNGNATFQSMGNAQNQGAASVLYLDEGPAAAGCPTGATGCLATGRAAGAGLFFAFPPFAANPNVLAFDETS